MDEFHELKSSGWLRKGSERPMEEDNDHSRGYLTSKLQSLFDRDADVDVKAYMKEAVEFAKTNLPGFDISRIDLDMDITKEQLIETATLVDNTGVYDRRRRLKGGQNNQEEVLPTANPFFGRIPDMKSLLNGENKLFRQAILDAHSKGSTKKYKGSTLNGKKNDRHRHLQANGSCPTPCEIDDTVCNCRRLYDCTDSITPTDLSIMYLNGYVFNLCLSLEI